MTQHNHIWPLPDEHGTWTCTDCGAELWGPRWRIANCRLEAMTVHTMPINDVIEHEADDDCFCGPTPDPVHRDDGSIGWVMVHHSIDGREFRERGEQIPKEQP